MKEKISQTANASEVLSGEVLPPADGSNIGKFFGDPYAERTAEEDPVFRYISNNWRRIITIVLAGVAAFYAYNVFRDTNRASMQASGDAFMRIQREFDAFRDLKGQLLNAKAKDLEKDAKAKEEADRLEKDFTDSKRKLEESLNALKNMREPYAEISQIYRGFLAAETGDGGNAKYIDPHAWQRISDKTSNARFLAEVGAFGWARSQMDIDANLGEVRKLLQGLARDGAYVYVGAGLSLAAISTTDAERKEALETLQTVLANHPEQDALLKDEIARLK